MDSFYQFNHRLQKMTLKALKLLCSKHQVLIDNQNLKIILRLMKDNPYSVIDEEFHAILLIQIQKVTDKETTESFKPILEEYCIHANAR